MFRIALKTFLEKKHRFVQVFAAAVVPFKEFNPEVTCE